jgi:lysophospholipase L1-like esterase
MHVEQRPTKPGLASRLRASLCLSAALVATATSGCLKNGEPTLPEPDADDAGLQDGASDARSDVDPDGADGSPEDGSPGDAPDGSSDGSPDGDADPGEPGVRLVGRYQGSLPGAARFGWSGTGIVVRFRGTGAAVRMDDPAGFFTVVVDGTVQQPLATEPGERTYDIASSLSDAVHTVELYRRTEGFFGPTTLVDVSVEGELLAPALPERRMEVIGDSITCGYGNEGPDQYCSFSAETENHYLTYAAVAAREVGAELHTVAWSGKGVVFNYGDDSVEPMPELYDRAIPTEAGSWGFAWEPDAVVVNLGTNDFSTDGDPTEEQFAAAYEAFLAHIRSGYPDALILCAVAPLLSGGDLEAAEAGIRRAISGRTTAGDRRVAFVDLSVDPIGWGCDWHPSAATHEAMAARLVDILGRRLGW